MIGVRVLAHQSQYMYSDYFDLPDDTRIDSSPKASNQKIKLLEEVVTIDDSEQS